MDSSQVIEVAFKALTMAFVLSGPVLIALLIAGLIIGILQAATSINESSVAFIPKLIVIAVVLLIFAYRAVPKAEATLAQRAGE